MLILRMMAPKLTHLPSGSAVPASVNDSNLDPMKIGIMSLGWRSKFASMNDGKETVSIDCKWISSLVSACQLANLFPRLTANIPLLSAHGRGHHRIMITKMVPFAFFDQDSLS